MMTIHEVFTSAIDEASLLDHLSREPRRPAGPAVPASAANNVTHHRHGARTGAFTGLIHCFTGTQRLADASLALGLMISVSGIATFKNSQALRDVIKTVPLDRLLVETDAPFLAPVPHRGKTNEPAFVVHTARMLAELKGISEAELAVATTDNFFRLFRKVKRPG